MQDTTIYGSGRPLNQAIVILPITYFCKKTKCDVCKQMCSAHADMSLVEGETL